MSTGEVTTFTGAYGLDQANVENGRTFYGYPLGFYASAPATLTNVRIQWLGSTPAGAPGFRFGNLYLSDTAVL